MGAGQSRNRNAQYPYGAPLYPPPYPPPPPPLPPQFVPPYGYGQPVYPGSVMPPTAQFGQGHYPPPPLLNFLPQDKYFKKKSSRAKKSRRTQSERFVGGFPSGAAMPQPEGEDHKHLSQCFLTGIQAHSGEQRPIPMHEPTKLLHNVSLLLLFAPHPYNAS